ncbi:ARM repeat-containing protein [Cystobasidium minutum MCA 4210]|uniref:ARM repeat-containing protein n=1 Tax=Cystobasidium minutum MCA 4210 TaxID=1397322 RepID=UPI0034CDFAF3|eukprot:jgi/Rhomi1/208229/estExt_Genemark1.C_1_t30261
MHSGTSLESWESRINEQLKDVLEPPQDRYTEISPTEALTISLNANTKWTLIALANLARDEEDSALRTLALVTLREFVVREAHDRDSTKLWDVIAVSTQNAVQKALLDCFENEQSAESEREAKTLCRTCSYILELNNASGHGWPELDDTLRNLLSPTASLNRQKLFYAFISEYPTVVADMSISDLTQSLRHGLGALDKDVSLTADALKACVAVLKFDDRFEEFKGLIPEMLNTLPLFHARSAAPELSKSLYHLLDLYDSPSLENLTPYITSIIPFLLSLLPNTTIDYLRQASIEFLTATSEYFSSSLMKDHQLKQEYEMFISALLNIMTEMKDGESADAEFWKGTAENDNDDGGETYVVAEDALNRVALALGPIHVLPTAFRIIPTLLSDTDWRKRYAALSAIGTLAEASAKEYLGNVEQIMRMVLDGLAAPSPRVVYAAVYAAAELCTYLSGIVQEKFGEELLSALYRIINTPYAPGRLVAYSCAAIVNFTADLQTVPQAFVQHSPAIIERLLQLVANENSRDDVRLKAMSAAAQSASTLAGEGELTPQMLQGFLEVFWPFLTGDIENDVKARAIDCATLLAASVDKAMLEPYTQKFITTLIHIEQTHTSADDPCTLQVLTGLARIAEVLREDFLPHVDAVIPRLLRIASTQVDQPHEERTGMEAEEGADDDDDEHFTVQSGATGKLVKINSSSLQEKTQAAQLLTSLAHSLGVGLTETGESQNTTGEWMSYAETMLNIAGDLVGYEYSSDIRQASAAALPALIRAFSISTRHAEEYNKNRMKSVVAPLLSAMAFEQDPEVLSAQFAATSDIVLAAPDIFTASNAEIFVKTCGEQIEELQRVMSEGPTEDFDKASMEEYALAVRSTLEYMSASLQAFIKTSGPAFPAHGLAGVLNQAIGQQLGLEGEKEWALRLICDLIQYASPAAVAWTSGLLSVVREGLSDLKPLIRQICAFTVGTAAMNPEGLYAVFCRSCVEPLCNGLSVETDLEDEEEALAHDNFVSALSKLIMNSSTLQINADELLPVWLKGLPIRADMDEMEPTYGLLLDIIAREHPFVAPDHEDVREAVLEAFAAALSNPDLPPVLQEPLTIGFQRYLERTPLETQHAWSARLTSQ